MNTDTCCTIAPYFKIHEGKTEAFKAACGAFVEATHAEDGAMFYGFSFDGGVAHCREGYKDAEALMAHLKNVGGLLQEAFKIADLVRFEIHAPADQIEKMRGPLAKMKPQFFTVECGFRR